MKTVQCASLNDHEGNVRGPYGKLCTSASLAPDGTLCDCWCHEPRKGHRHKWGAFYIEATTFDGTPTRIEESCDCGAERVRKLVKRPVYKTVRFRKKGE